MNDFIYSVVWVASALGTGLFLAFAATTVAKKFKNVFVKTETRILIEHLKDSLWGLLPALCLLLSRPFLRFHDQDHGIVAQAINLLIVGAWGWFFITLIHSARDIVLDSHNIHAKNNLSARRIYTQVRVLSQMGVSVIVILTVAFMLLTNPHVKEIGVSLLASAGLVGVVAGFAAQKTLGNVIAGVQIALAQPIRLDDVVIVKGEWGWIEEITLTHVVLKIWDLRRLIIPLSFFVDEAFENWTRTSSALLGTVLIYADYRVPVDAVRKAFADILENSSRWDRQVSVLQVTNATDRSIELRALMSAADSSILWDLRCEVREKLLAFLQNEYPQCLPRIRLEAENLAARTEPSPLKLPPAN